MPYGEPLRFTTRWIKRVTLVNPAEKVRRKCLARTPLTDVFRILLNSHHSPLTFLIAHFHAVKFLQIQPIGNRYMSFSTVSWENAE